MHKLLPFIQAYREKGRVISAARAIGMPRSTGYIYAARIGDVMRKALYIDMTRLGFLQIICFSRATHMQGACLLHDSRLERWNIYENTCFSLLGHMRCTVYYIPHRHVERFLNEVNPISFFIVDEICKQEGCSL